MAEAPRQPTKQEIEDITRVGTYLVQLFIEKHNVPATRQRQLNPVAVYGWLQVQMDEGEITTSSVSESLDLEYSRAEATLACFRSPANVSRFMALFPMLILGDDSATHPILSVNFMVLVRWADGTTFPISRSMHRDVLGKIAESNVYATGLREMPSLILQAMAMGLDQFHDNGGANVGSEADLELLSGIIDDFHPLEESDRTRLRQLVGFFSHVLIDRIPEEQMRQIRKMQGDREPG